LLAEQKTLRNDVTALESRKTELADLGNRLEKLQVSSKADLENAKGQSESVRIEIEKRVGELTETLRETQAAGEKAKLDFERQLRETREAQEKAKLDFERQLREMREEFRSGVGAIRKEVDAQVTDTKMEVTEIRRSTAPVKVEVDGRTFDALPADRDSYFAAISRVKNASQAKAPREEYEAAGADVQKFMDSVANPGFRGSAFYWLIMAQAGAGQCKDALVSFEEMRKLVDTVRHPRYPDAMLQKATCHHMLKEPQERDRWVRELLGQFPESSAAGTARTLLPAPAPTPTPAPRKNR
jgi:TolA-binding protein